MSFDPLADLRHDIARYTATSRQSWPMALLTNQGLWVTCQYRISRWVHYRVQLPVLRPILKTVCAVWRKLIEMTTHCELSNRAEIGGGIYMPHAFGVIVHSEARIGAHCNIGHRVTIGVGVRPGRGGAPTLGDRVFVGTGAVLFGPIRIGDDVAIGANAVVLSDLPPGVVAVGVPARVVSLQGSAGLLDGGGPAAAAAGTDHEPIPMTRCR